MRAKFEFQSDDNEAFYRGSERDLKCILTLHAYF